MMERVTELLLDQTVYQEMAFLLLENEGNLLLELEEAMKQVLKENDEEKRDGQEAEAQAKKVIDLKARLAKKTLQPEDKVLITLHGILTNLGNNLNNCM